MDNERDFPPRCCRAPITFENAKKLLTTQMKQRFRAKEAEYSIGNKTYCSVSTCSRFIPPANITDKVHATCPKCKALTCAACKNAFHLCSECPEDQGRRAMLQHATENGWSQCRRCYHIVEIQDGCNHIICQCGHNFCYLCGAAWKTCSCDILTRDAAIGLAGWHQQNGLDELE